MCERIVTLTSACSMFAVVKSSYKKPLPPVMRQKFGGTAAGEFCGGYKQGAYNSFNIAAMEVFRHSSEPEPTRSSPSRVRCVLLSNT